ncbi:hypothetical protein PMAYCL1PPCAC_08184 [Pristionchus mayeri]|uniref:Uncharacterized protein n=1 Tax=Pristionchus mayeri TaxID=1317129 RepID=A0AAN4ZDJ2_9BILA|nr:hypothetical protein PMAYCL1PPCAC_08184 [Pristionchus mayeri]
METSYNNSIAPAVCFIIAIMCYLVFLLVSTSFASSHLLSSSSSSFAFSPEKITREEGVAYNKDTAEIIGNFRFQRSTIEIEKRSKRTIQRVINLKDEFSVGLQKLFEDPGEFKIGTC